MKKNINIKIVGFVLVALMLASCSNSDSISESQIDTGTPILSGLDIWLRNNFVAPYNINITYLWDANNTNLSRFLYPPLEENVRPLANALFKTWIEPYNKLGGDDFIANIAPRQFVFSGGFNYNPNSPTITLGLAEAGVRITLFNVDFLDYSNVNSISRPIKTVQHEYAHILNQNIPINPAYGQINPADYTAQWFNRSDAEARGLGYITAYGSSQESEDFVEMVSEMLTNTRAEFDAIVDGITSTDSIAGVRARAIIRIKEVMVVEYYQTNFGIDIYELQELTSQALIDLTN